MPAKRQPAHGPNRTAAEAAVAALDVDPKVEPLAALVISLAATLDDGAGSQTANVAREYRVALDRLRVIKPEHDPLDDFLASLSDPVVSDTDG